MIIVRISTSTISAFLLLTSLVLGISDKVVAQLPDGADNASTNNFQLPADDLRGAYGDITGTPGGFGFGNPLNEEQQLVRVQAVIAVTDIKPEGVGTPVLFVEANVEPGWHIYSITQKPGGTIPTEITLQPSSDYLLAGDWLVRPQPKSHVEPLFDNMTIEEHSGRVVWSVPIQIARGVDIRNLKIEGTLTAQPCSDTGCMNKMSFPFLAAYGEVPELPQEAAAHDNTSSGTQTGLPNEGTGLPGVDSTGLPFEDDALPGGEFSNDPVGSAVDGAEEEPLVKVTSRFAMDVPECDGTGPMIYVEADIKEPWHIYSITQEPGGPIATEIELTPSDDYKITGLWESAPAPLSHVEPLFGDINVEEHIGRVVWHAPIQFAEGVDPEKLEIEGTLYAQPCSDTGCMAKTPFAFTATFGEPIELPGCHPIEPLPFSKLFRFIVLAFFGGLILNVMPCVLPVIGLKIMSFFQQAGHDRVRAFWLNFWYSAGVIALFLVLAFFAIGVGGLFSSNVFTIVLACLVFILALSLMDIWEIRMPSLFSGGKASVLMQKEGPVGAFFKGVLTTILASSCGAPLMSTALQFAKDQSDAGHAWVVYIVYGVVGLGMASPYLIIGAFPELLRFLPKPGEWMDTFKKVMGYLLLTAVIWLLWNMPIEFILPTVSFMFALWFACWLIGRLPLTTPPATRLTMWSVGLVVCLISGYLAFVWPLPEAMQERAVLRGEALQTQVEQNWAEEIWTPFREDKLAQAVEDKQTVAIEFTTKACLTCKYLAATVLHSSEVEEFVRENGVVTMQADCTKPGPELDLLNEYGGLPVPKVVVYPNGDMENPILFADGWVNAEQLIDAMQGIRPEGDGEESEK